MRNNKKRGFTLVELLVVIAILAILATVSVVGYTAFIQRASISNDENVAAQLNKFLVAVKADSTGPFYNEEITEDNVWEITQYIISEGGLGELEAQSAQYGYHIYFKFNADGKDGEYVVRKEEGLTHSLAIRLWGFLSGRAANEELSMPGIFSETVGGVTTYYFLAETGGSDIADAVRGFYTLDNEAFGGDISKFFDLISDADFLTEYGNELYTLALKSVFVTANGNYVIDADVDPVHSKLFILKDAEYIYNNKQEIGGTPVYASDANPLVTVDRNTTIRLPADVKLPANSLNIAAAEGKTVTVIINAKSWEDILDKVDANFTNDNVIIELAGKTYVLRNGNGGDGNYVYEYDVETKTVGAHVATLSNNNFPVTQFTIQCDDATANPNEGSAYLTGDKLYLAYVPGQTYQLKVDGFNADASNHDVIWSGSIVSATGLITIPDMGDGHDAEDVYEYALTATSKDGNHSETITIRIDRIVSAPAKNVAVTMNGNFNDNIIELDYKATGVDFEILDAIGDSNRKYPGYVICDTTVTITEAEMETPVFEIDGNTLTLKQFSGTQSFTIKIGDSITETFTLKVNNKSESPFIPKTISGDVKIGTSYLYRVGNKNAFTLGDLYEVKSGETLSNDTISVKVYNLLSASMDANTGRYILNDTDLLSSKTDLTKDNWKNYEINFSSLNYTGLVCVQIQSGSTLAYELYLEVVDAKNVDAYSDLINGNCVLLSDITMGSGGSYYLSNATLYGNGYTFDVKKGAYSGSGALTTNYLVGLNNATIDNVNIVGSVYTAYGVSTSSDYNRPVILTIGNCGIYNSYISNCGAPVRVCSGNLKIDNTTLKGGAFANLDIRNGNVVLNNVTTINQIGLNDKSESNTEILGLGIVVYYEGVGAETSIEIINDSLTQYNFVSNAHADYTADNRSKAFIDIAFGEDFVDYQYNDGTNLWINTGIVSMSGAQFGSDNVINKPSKYSVKDDISISGVAACLWSLPGNNISTEKEKVPSTYTWIPTEQMIYTPKFTYDPTQFGNEPAVGTEPDDYSYYKNGIIYVGNSSKTAVFNALNGLAVYKYSGQEWIINITTSSTGKVELVEGEYIATFTDSGTITYTVSNTYYGTDGSVQNGTTYSLTVPVMVVDTDIKNATITFTSNPTDGAYKKGGDGTDYHLCMPILGFTVTDYDPIQDKMVNVTISNDNLIVNLGGSGQKGKLVITSITGSGSYTISGGTAFETIDNIYYLRSEGVVNNTGTYTMNVTYTYIGYNGMTVTAVRTFNYTKDSKTHSCVAEGTLITLADGTKKPVEDLTSEDMLLVFNHETGKHEAGYIWFVDTEEKKEYNIVNLEFSNGSTVRVVDTHGFYDLDLNKYAFITEENYQEYVGHDFYSTEWNGTEFEGNSATLVNAYVTTEELRVFSPITVYHFNYFTEGMLSMPAMPLEHHEITNIFTYDDNMMYDEEQMQKDIETYGIFTYEELADYITYEMYEATPVRYFKIAIGKGIITFEDLENIIKWLDDKGYLE